MKILAQGSSLLGKMVSTAKESAPVSIAKWLERADAAFFSDLKNEASGEGDGSAHGAHIEVDPR